MWKSLKLLLLTVSVVSSAKLSCDYRSQDNWSGFDETLHYCEVDDNGIFNVDRVKIDSVVRVYKNNVNGVHFRAIPSLKYFPQNLENIFGTLISISVENTNLQEIKQNDIKVFTGLKRLSLYSNKIKSIERGLFEFNPELRTIILNFNQISHIDMNVFDHLGHLSTLYLYGNKCKSDFENANSRSEVLEVVERVRNGECTADGGL